MKTSVSAGVFLSSRPRPGIAVDAERFARSAGRFTSRPKRSILDIGARLSTRSEARLADPKRATRKLIHHPKTRMWSIDSLWFEIAVVSAMFACGNILFGRFEERTPRWRRLLKYFLFLALTVLISWLFGRVWALCFLAAIASGAFYVHAVALPRKGINGWTGEPKDLYYKLRGWDTGE